MKLNASDWLPEEPDFELIHIYCHQKDYRLCFALNEQFKWNFSRVRDFAEEAEHQKAPTYSRFLYEDEVNHKEFFIISNQPLVRELVAKEGDLFAAEQPTLLIPELPKVDYFFLLYGQFEEEELNEIEEQLNMVPAINAAKRVDTRSLKSYINLMH